MGEDIYKYRRKMLAETYLFRFQDEFLVNLYAMPTKKIFSKKKVYYDWENVIDIPVIIFDTKEHLSYKFYITYIERKHGNVIVSVKYKNNDTIMKYDSFIRGYFNRVISESHDYKYRIGHEEKGWKVVKHTRNKYGRKRYILKDLTVQEERFLEIDENKLLSRGFPKQKKRLKDLDVVHNEVINPEDTEHPIGSRKNIEVFCCGCRKRIFRKVSDVSRMPVYCYDCTKAISFPERVMQAVLESNNINYEMEVKIPELGQMRIDFVVYHREKIEFIEVNGAQHYNVSHKWYEHSYRADIAKKQYAERNNIPIYFVDAKQSDLRYILNLLKL